MENSAVVTAQLANLKLGEIFTALASGCELLDESSPCHRPE